MLSSPPSRRSRGQHTPRPSKGDTSRGTDQPASSPLRSYAKGKNSLWLLNSDTYSSVTMKMLIEKQAAAAARLNSPSRLEAFAADSPPRRRRRPGTPTKTSGGTDRRRGGRDAVSSPSPRRTASAGGIALSDLISATTPPKVRSSAVKVDVGGGAGRRRSLAQETYTKTFTGMQAYGESGMTILEELIDAAFRACDVGHAQGQQRVTGAALLTRSGKIFAGCNVESTSVDLSVGAERTTVLKAVSEGETRFRSMAMASDTDLGFPSPDGPGRQFLAEFGEFPVYLVNRDMQVKIASTSELYPMMPPGPIGVEAGRLGPGGARDEAIVAASREREKRPPRDWGVQEVLDWLEDELELGEYRREFVKAKVDGALLLNLEDKDLHDMFGMAHPLHRRRVCLGIQKIKDKEEEVLGKNYADMDDYVRRLDRDRVRLITKLKVVFDRFDKDGTGCLSAADAREALEYMGRDVNGEGCASWLVDKERKRGDISFVDFTTAYSALFVDEDPDVDLGEGGRGSACGRKEPGVSVMGSGHVRLRQKEAAQGRDRRAKGDGGRELWASGSSEDEGGPPAGGSRQSTPRKTPRGRSGERGARTAREDDDDPDLDDAQAEAFEALRSVKKLAEVKRVFDRFAVDGMLTAYEALQALTEAGCTAPRTHAGRYLRSRRFFGLRREVTFFEFLRSMAALGVHDSGAHVAGFAPSRIQLSGGGSSSVPLSARSGRRRRGYDDDDDDDDGDDDGIGGTYRGRGSGRVRRKRRPRSSREEADYDDDGSYDDDDEGSTSADEAYRDEYRRKPSSARGVSPRHGGGGGDGRRRGSNSPRRRSTGGDGLGLSPRRSPARGGGSRTRGSRVAGSGDSSSDLAGKSSTKRRRQSRSGESRLRGSSRSPRGRARGAREASDESATAGDSGSSEGSAFGRRSRSRRGGENARAHRGGAKSEQGRHRSRRGDRETDEDNSDRGGRQRDRDRDRDRHHSRTGASRHDRERPGGREKERSGGSGGERGDGGSTSAWARLKAQSPRAGGSNEGRRRREGGGASAGSFARGDRVEARYRGKGTKFYKGKISRVNSDDTLDIAYDDGEIEIGIAAEHVNPVEPSARGGGGGGGDKGEKMAKGDRVEARYRGKGTKFYKGKISRVNSDDTFDIAYDDGDKDVGIASEHVTSLEPVASARRGGDARGSKMVKGDRVEARYRGKGTKFYKGKISRVNSDDTLDIAYDDGEKEIGIALEHVNSLEPMARRGDGGTARGSKMAKGDRVEARYRGKGTKFYKGKISRVNSDGTLDIAYDDGEREIGLALEHVNSLEPSARGGDDGVARRSKMAKGDRVEARYRGKGTKFFKGKIARVNSDDTLDVAYDDGDKEIGISPEHVNSLEPTASGGSGSGARGHGMSKGDRVEARYRGKGTKFYKGKISRVNSDGTLDIAYDDGERETGIALEHVNSLERTSPGGGGSEGGRRSKMAKGDRVEARYRGKGTKFYKGKISRVNSDATLDIAYNDGEKEIGIALEHVNSLEPAARGGRSGARTGAESMAKGDRVEARYRGKGTKFYKGKISRVNSDDTFDIAYDDGDKEVGIAEEHVRSLESQNNSAADRDRRAPVGLMEGDKVEADHRGRGRYYPGRITRVHRDGTYDIDYDDGERERMVEPSLVKALQSKDERAGSGRLAEGTKVEARYKGRSRYYPGRITRVHRDGTLDIDYDDGERERMVEPSLVKAFETEKTESRLEEGMKVEARFKGRSRYYPGRITRVHRDGSCDIDYDDGERERMVGPSSIRTMQNSADRAGTDRFAEGMKVEARYKGRNRYFPGRVTRMHRDGTYDIDYDDGERERGITEDLIRSSERAHSRDNDGGASGVRGRAFQRGDKVEARYRGKGTKFYKGKISRVNSDATLDIAYDDGEKEIGIAVEHVNSLEPTVRGGGGTESKMVRGDRVEARYRGKGAKFYKGKISRVNSDGTLDIAYDDGEKEIGIALEHVNSLEPTARSGGSDTRRGAETIAKGDRVEARYRGKGTKFYKGKISRVNSDETFDIAYDDGEKEIGIVAEHVRSLESQNNAAADRGREPHAALLEGDKVEANYRGRGRYYKGRISRVNLDGTCNIDYDDGEKERGVTDNLIRTLAGRGGGGGVEIGSPSRLKVTAGRVSARDTADDDERVPYRRDRHGGQPSPSRSVRDTAVDDERVPYRRDRHGGRPSPSRGGGRGGRGEGRSRLQKGERVEARYRGKGTKFYKGKISRVNSDDTFDIAYDDGEREMGIAEEHVRSLEQGVSTPAKSNNRDDDADDADGSTLLEGDRVEGNFQGQGRFYKGRVSRLNLDGTINIDYDDGEKEIGVKRGMVRPLDRNSSGAGSRRGSHHDSPSRGRGGESRRRKQLQRGDRVEARYRGKGTKFYKGRVSRVNSDATLDIAYDDGETEIGIDEEHVREVA